MIGAQNPRQKVLPNGDLLISPLRWSDMGTYTCIARNPISKDTAETFVYPSVSWMMIILKKKIWKILFEIHFGIFSIFYKKNSIFETQI